LICRWLTVDRSTVDDGQQDDEGQVDG
jgi:hypothetical protein